MSWFSRLRNALHPQRLDEDLLDEVRDHVERRAADLRNRGLSADEARHQASARFGNVTKLREQSREIRLWAALESTLQDARYAWRGMLKSPAFSATAVLSLSLAIGANTAIYSIVDAAMLRPLPVPEPERLLTLATPPVEQSGTDASGENDLFSYPLYVQFRGAAGDSAHLAAFSGVARVEAQQGQDQNAPFEKLNQQLISGEAFEILRVPPALGRLFSNEEDRGVSGHSDVVISHDYWQRRFGGDPAILGRTIRINGRPSPFRIIGVTAQGFFGVEPGKFVDVWLPVMTFDPSAFTNPAFRWLRIAGRLGGSATREQVQARLQPSFHDHQEDMIKGSNVPPTIQQQFRDMAIRVHPGAVGASGFRKTFGRALWIVLGVAAGMLLIACANVASLLLARSTARSAEMAMRVSLGAGRSRLVRQLLTENLLLSALAGGLGWMLASLTAPALIGMLSKEGDPVRFALTMDTRVLLFCAGVCTLSALFFGLLPAWHATATQQSIFAWRHRTGQAGKLRMGRLFVGVQVAFAFCLVVAGSGFLFSLRNLFAVDTGFDPRGVTVLTINNDARKPQLNDTRKLQLQVMQQLPREIAALPNIQGAAIGWWAIFEGSRRAEPVILPGKPPSGRDEIFYRISPAYFAALRTPLLNGRDFEINDNDAGQPVPTIVNIAFARRYFGGEAVLGREFQRSDGTRHQIVGVAANAYYGDLRNGPEPIAYFPLKPGGHFALYIRSTLDPGSLARMVEREAKAVGPGIRVVEMTTLDTLVGNTLLREKLLAGIGGAFAFLGLALAGIGLFGLLSYSVARRTKEIGIRAALGARRGEIVLLVLKDLLVMVGGGLAAGLAGSITLMIVLQSLLFGLRAADPIVLGTAIAVFLIAAFAAGGLPAMRAAAVDPVVALREE